MSISMPCIQEGIHQPNPLGTIMQYNDRQRHLIPCQTSVLTAQCLASAARLTRTMVKDGRCRWAGSFLLSPTLLGLGSGRFLCRCVTSCLGLLGFRAGFATTLRASAAVVERATGAPLAGLLVRPAFATLILLVLLTIPHRSRTGWPPGANTRREGEKTTCCWQSTVGKSTI